MKQYFLLKLLIASLIVMPSIVKAQEKFIVDSSYIKTFPNYFTGRIYLSKKYAQLSFPAFENVPHLKYNPNTKLAFGIGGTYHNFTLNLAYGFSFLNHNIEERGETKSFDLQIHLYPKSLAVDAIGTLFKSVYAYPKGFAAPGPNTYYIRPDAKFDFIGLAVYKVQNAEKFSYKAAMVQSELQQKSAGSLLYGGEVFYSVIKGDSSLIPKAVAANVPQQNISNVHFISFGPGIGYAYTIVAGKHFFLMGSLIGNLNVDFGTEVSSTSKNNTSIAPDIVYKAAIGYNGNVWNISANWAANTALENGAASSEHYTLTEGNIRLNIAKRIFVKHK